MFLFLSAHQSILVVLLLFFFHLIIKIFFRSGKFNFNLRFSNKLNHLSPHKSPQRQHMFNILQFLFRQNVTMFHGQKSSKLAILNLNRSLPLQIPANNPLYRDPHLNFVQIQAVPPFHHTILHRNIDFAVFPNLLNPSNNNFILMKKGLWVCNVAIR